MGPVHLDCGAGLPQKRPRAPRHLDARARLVHPEVRRPRSGARCPGGGARRTFASIGEGQARGGGREGDVVASTQVCAVVVLPLFYRPSQRGVPHAVARRSRLRTYGLLITVYLSCAVCRTGSVDCYNPPPARKDALIYTQKPPPAGAELAAPWRWAMALPLLKSRTPYPFGLAFSLYR